MRSFYRTFKQVNYTQVKIAFLVYQQQTKSTMHIIQKNKTEQNNQILQHCLMHGLVHLLYTLHSAHPFAFKQIQEKNYNV